MPLRSGLRRLALVGGLLVLAAPPAVLLGGCTGGGIAAAETAQEAYDRGMADFQRRRYDTATEHFRAALDFGRGTPVARDAQLQLARAHNENREYLLAGQEFTRFIELYPDDARVQDTEYERLMSYYRLSPSYELDPTDTERAIQYIQLFLVRYPDGPHATEAQTMMEELREKLARKRYEAARLYERREMFEAAVMTYRSVLADFPTSPWTDEAMFGALRSQVRYAEVSVPMRQVERFSEGLALYDRLVELFPTSPYLTEAQVYYDRAYTGRRDAEARLAALSARPAAAPVPAPEAAPVTDEPTRTAGDGR
ncbi:MAG TPA: outer membrane protein assembly factor BamD [Rhodothermales bacterium]|nr:outer membrane protein assembly factor BamD [Rhodothermales bacterium]